MRTTFVLTVAALVLATGTAHAVPKVWQQKWDVSPKPSVRVVATDAHVTIHSGPAGVVSARVEHELRTWGFVANKIEPTVTFVQSGNTYTVTVRERNGVVVLGGLFERTTVDVTLPAEADLAVRTGDGAIDCDPVQGIVRLETGDGAIRARGLRGEISIATGDGSVTADDLEGSLRAHSGDGKLIIGGRFDRLELSTGDGRIDATANKGSQMAEAWNVETGDGSMTLRIPHDLKAYVDVHTNDGHVRVDLPISVKGDLSRRDLTGELNGGGRTLRMRTGDGPITLGLSD